MNCKVNDCQKALLEAEIERLRDLLTAHQKEEWRLSAVLMRIARSSDGKCRDGIGEWVSVLAREAVTNAALNPQEIA